MNTPKAPLPLPPVPCSEAPEEQMDDNHAICPYCRHENHVEAEDYDSNERDQECAECGKTYLQYDDFTVTHYTRPQNKDYPDPKST
jgi:DNA-directed RNA polymerase subunit RPC12/RpoP